MYPPVPVYLPPEPKTPVPLDDVNRRVLSQGSTADQAAFAAAVIDTMDDERLESLPLADQFLLADKIMAAPHETKSNRRPPLVRLVQSMRLPEAWLDAEKQWAKTICSVPDNHPLSRKQAKHWANLPAASRLSALASWLTVRSGVDSNFGVSLVSQPADSLGHLRLYSSKISDQQPSASPMPMYEITINSHPDGIFGKQADTVCAVIDSVSRLRQDLLIGKFDRDAASLTADEADAARVLKLSAYVAEQSKNIVINAGLPSTTHLRANVGVAFAHLRPVMDDFMKFLLTDPKPVKTAVAGTPGMRYTPVVIA